MPHKKSGIVLSRVVQEYALVGRTNDTLVSIVRAVGRVTAMEQKMSERLAFVFAVLLMMVTMAGAGCGGDKSDSASKPQARERASAKGEKAGKRISRELRGHKRAIPADGGVAPQKPEATAKTSPELIGVWEKVDQPGRGMRIEFPAIGGLYEVKVVAPPVNDAASLAFFKERNAGNEKRAARDATCIMHTWEAGKVRYSDLSPSGATEWTGDELVSLFPLAVLDCSVFNLKRLKVTLKLEAQDRLVVTKKADKPSPSAPQEPLAVWKRVVEEKAAAEKTAEKKPEKKSPAEKKPGKKKKAGEK